MLEWRDPLPGVRFGLAHLRHPRAFDPAVPRRHRARARRRLATLAVRMRDRGRRPPGRAQLVRATVGSARSLAGSRLGGDLPLGDVGAVDRRRRHAVERRGRPRRARPPARHAAARRAGRPPRRQRRRGQRPAAGRRLLLVQDQPGAGRAAAPARPRRRRRGHLAVRAVAGPAPRRARRAHHLQRSGEVAGVDPRRRSATACSLVNANSRRRGGADRPPRRRGAARRPPRPPACRCRARGAGSSASPASTRRPTWCAPRSTTRGSSCAGVHVHRGGDDPSRRRRWPRTSPACSHALRRAPRRRPAGTRRSSTSAAAWPARRRHRFPTRQFRLNRALGTDLLPPDPADCLTHRRLPPTLAAIARRASTPRQPASPMPRLRARAGPGADRRHAVPADERRRRQGRRRRSPTPCSTPGSTSPSRCAREYHQLFSVSAPGASPTTAVPPRRADLHAGRRALQPLAAAAAGTRARPRDHGRRRLLRAVLDDVLVPQAGDRDAGRRRRHACARRREDVRRRRRPRRRLTR